MKKKLLFVLPTLEAGGVTKVFLNLINILHKEGYEIHLLLIDKAGEYMNDIPAYVNIQELTDDVFIKSYIFKGHKALHEMDDKYHYLFTHCFLMMYILFNTLTKKVLKRNISYQYISKKYAKKYKGYNIVIDFYGLGSFTTYMVSNIETGIRLSWVHNEVYVEDYALSKKEYEVYDTIVGVSEECVINFKERFPKIASRCKVLHNINEIDNIIAMSKEKIDFDWSDFSIVSVGRLSEEKNFSFAIKVSNLIKKEIPDFCWYIIGEGKEKEKLKREITKLGLEKNVILVGFDKNPYKYIASANIYAQTSKVEGFCTTISEAIVLGRAIVSTRFSGIDEQVKDGTNGFICKEEEAFAGKIIYLYRNRNVIQDFEIKSLERDMSYVDETKKFFHAITQKGVIL